MAGLPDEAMLEILARTPLRSVCRSKCVAKAWRGLIDDPLNRRRPPQTLQGFFSTFFHRGNLDSCFVKYSTTSLPLDIDPCLSFLAKVPEIERLYLIDSCNGLLLFSHSRKSDLYDVVGYIVCNPATKHWATVPVCACFSQTGIGSKQALAGSNTYLAFDPVVSSHFHLIRFWNRALSVHTYSSETGVWNHSQTDQNEQGQLEGWRRHGRLRFRREEQRTFVNGILYLIVLGLHQPQIVAVDVEGKTKRIIPAPVAAEGRRWYRSPCIGHSQGRLHYINQDFDAHDSSSVQSSELSIWELKDYDTQEWVLKDTVSLDTLFGRMADMWELVVIHPDRNVVFFDEPLSGLIAYDMDHKEVSVVAVPSENKRRVVPYIPYFSVIGTHK